MKQRRLAVMLGVILAGSALLAWGVWRHSASRDYLGRPAGLLPLADATAFPADSQVAVRAVADALARSGEPPEEFFAKIESPRADGMVIFHLWHHSAWDPKNRRGVGNPGGKCRDAYFDPSRGEVMKMLFWQ